VTTTKATRYLTPGYTLNDIAPTNPVYLVMPRPGTIDHLYVEHNQLGGSANLVVYTLFVNGAPTALTCTLAANAPQASDLVHSVPVLQGDLVTIEVTKAVNLVGGEMHQIVASARVRG